MSKLVIANWKSNPSTSAEAIRLAKESTKDAPKNVDVVLCAPSVFLESLSKTLQVSSFRFQAALGAQDLFWESPPAGGGPYTGEILPSMLKKLKVSHAIIGHSERRRLLHETEDMINKKVLAALNAGIVPILCVGEPEQRGKSKGESEKLAQNYIRKQLEKDLKGLSVRSSLSSHPLIVCYEPAWSISTAHGVKGQNNADTPANATRMIRNIKNYLTSHLFPLSSFHFIYGGSVNPKNAEAFLNEPEIDGVLVGGASLKPAEFRSILKIASQA